MVHGIVDEGRVHRDVAVVGQKQVSGTGFELFDACVGNAIGRPVNGMVDVVLDFVLQRSHGGDAGKFTAQLAAIIGLSSQPRAPAKRGKRKWVRMSRKALSLNSRSSTAGTSLSL